MSEKEVVEIERDEAINNEVIIATEYDISLDVANGKVFIASNLDNSNVIIQGIMTAYRKGNAKRGDETITLDREGLESIGGDVTAFFTGNIFFEHLPCTVVVNGTKESVVQAIEEQAKEEKVVEEAVIVAEEKAVDTQKYPDLTKDTFKGPIVAPSGLSRTERKTWWQTLRKMYPDKFDANGNYVMAAAPVVQSPQKVEQETQITEALVAIKAEEKPKAQERAPKLLKASELGFGAGNSFTNMADHKIRSSFFMGQYFPSKDSYSVLSTPAKIFEQAKYIFINKERTAEMFLAGLRSSPSFGKLLNGHEMVVPATVLKNTTFTDKYPVYYVTNVVTALQALGLEEIPSEKVQ